MGPPAYQFRGNDGPSNNNSSDRNDRNDRNDRGGRSRGRPRGRGRGGRGGNAGRGGFEFSFRFPPTAERPLLSTEREKTPELLLAEDASEKPALKFASLDALSDSEEAEMDFSDSDEEARPRKKRALGADGNDSPVELPPTPPPKWSNPDPYTALPPPDESQHKRVDMVKLIRKARLANATQAKQNDAVVDNQDFISLGMPDAASGQKSNEPNKPENEVPENSAPENAPKGPKGMEAKGIEIKGTALKRARSGQIKGKPVPKHNSDCSIISEWRALPNQNSTPWLSTNTPHLNPAARLHNEIIAFYNWVRPHYYEQIVREDLVLRLKTALRNRPARYHYGRKADHSSDTLEAYGSFASGLYLPIADIDLVLFSGKTKGYPPNPRSTLFGCADHLEKTDDTGFAAHKSVLRIAGARVPILKLIDNLTGLPVDISFDNDTGTPANVTFRAWKEEFPTMPAIVSVIKQFLLLRGLNEVSTGGLGGFSITCLVVSLLQHMPKNEQQNVGYVLLNFFDFYGNQFEYWTYGIRMNPAGYFNKLDKYADVPSFTNRDRLMIEDPNTKRHDISGGTHEISLIFRAFSQAHRALKTRMDTCATRPNASLLDVIIAANYDEYSEQRDVLRDVYDHAPQFAHIRNAPPPPPPVRESPPPPPPDNP
ncbi:topoisomerase family protein TRF4 [Penicillium odoratum]|uniref:topoisomerase family protein TRF4 n=1 Tax=Penicillium odoratum TaxID=1167516 RepID=UPI0025486607|nr:topoisomerase family protein TRF4 [Penicillium odoratum]KAJ5752481.1 topoisomerase family protein TRF4 [Penicillium odoratum]